MFAASKTASTSGYQISRSLRFNSVDSAYLSRTPASATNQQTWTWSAWVKVSALGAQNAIACVSVGGGLVDDTGFYFTSGNAIDFYTRSSGSLLGFITTTAVYRDPSAWYHLVIVYDATNATSANRMRIYVNGVLQAVTVNNTLPQNTSSQFNSTNPFWLGRNQTVYSNFYMTEVNFIDGQALTPSSFGATSAITGVWSPIQYTGTYGTNGFYLNFLDNSNTIAATLGKDYSGNGNNWTPNNFSVTAGAGNDSLVDSPTSYGGDTGIGGEVRGNYCTLNPLYSSGTISDGSLKHTATASTWVNTSSTIFVSSGKWYFEATNIAGNFTMIGVATNSASVSTNYGTATNTWTYFNDGQKYGNGVAGTAYGASYTTGDVIGVALDMDNGTLTFYKNNTSQGTAFNTGLTGLTLTPWFGSYTSNNGVNVNFGQRAFAYTAPSGFKALCTQNLPTPTVGATSATQAGKYYNAVLWTGTGDSLNRSISGVGFQPDFVWGKRRSDAANHQLYDVVRGAGTGKELSTNITGVEGLVSVLYGYLSSFDTDGFSTAKGTVNNDLWNVSGSTFVAWNWKANGAGSSNTSGSITSTVSASTISGFSVVTYTGTGANATVGHGLGVAPSMIIVKSRSQVVNWLVWHTSLPTPSTAYLLLNLTDASANAPTTVWNSTVPTSSVFSLGTNVSVNNSASTYVAYCFAEVAGYSKFGSYTGNGSADGPFVFTGFRPAFVLTKRTDNTGDWQLMDSSRDTYNVANKALFPNYALAESTGYSKDFLSNGFKIRDSGASLNASGGTYIYMAFASAPLKFSLAR